MFSCKNCGSRTIASKEHCASAPKLTLIQTLTLAGGGRQISLEVIVWLPPNPKTNPNLDPDPNPNRKAVFLGGQLPGYQKLRSLFEHILYKSRLDDCL